MANTLFDKVWDAHEIAVLPGGVSLLHVDRHLVHELTGVEAIKALERRHATVRNPELTFATVDHVTSTRPGRKAGDAPWSTAMVNALRAQTAEKGIRIFDMDQGTQGIVHVIGPELGLTLPGLSIVCGDSHTCTHGAFGAISWGIGSSELVHVLATQTIRQIRPRTMRINFTGTPGPSITAKDMILHLIGVLGASAGTGYAVEYAGSAISALDMEARMTLCNLSIELGAKVGMIAPDETTFCYVKGRAFAPAGDDFDRAVAYWQTLPSGDSASFDREEEVDISRIMPQVTWGTSPEMVLSVDGRVPDPDKEKDDVRRSGMERALQYMGLKPNTPLVDISVDRIFIGSCTNARIEDLRAAALVARGKRVASSVKQAMVVPGSGLVKLQAEREGLDKIFLEAGFEWREPGCSMCLAMNADRLEPGERCASTSNRNFEGRQGQGGRTHLVSPAMAAAAAIAGHFVDVRNFR